MLRRYLLKNKQHVVDLFTALHPSYGLTSYMVNVFSLNINWKICDTSGFPILDVSDKARFAMLYDEDNDLYFPTIDDFECCFDFPVLVSIRTLLINDQPIIDDVYIKHLEGISRLAHPYQPVPYNWISQLEKLITLEHMQKSPNLAYLVRQIEDTGHPAIIFNVLETMLHTSTINMNYAVFLTHIRQSRYHNFLPCVINVVGDTDPYFVDPLFKERHTWNDIFIMEHFMNCMADHRIKWPTVSEKQNVQSN